MAGTTTKMSQIKQILIHREQGNGRKTIARILGISKTTVKSIFERLDQLKALGHSYQQILDMDEPELERKLFSGNPSYKENERYDYLKRNFEYYQKELKRVGVTRQLLWEEYHKDQEDGYSYSQFCHHLQQIGKTARPTLKLEHKAGDKLYIDFAGSPLYYVDRQTGEQIKCQVFVACLPHSDYAFAMAVEDQTVKSLIQALIACFVFLGGVPFSIVTDNLKASVIKPDRYEPSIQQAMEDMANHYGTAIVPTRTYKPKDKALVENQVKLIYQRIYAKLRNQVFFDIGELNRAIIEKVMEHNQTRMQQKPYCREERFLANEKPILKPLPEERFEIKSYKRLRVAKNNHVYLSDDKHYYSVPYTCIGEMANLLYTRNMVHIYCKGEQVAVHIRNYKMGGYSTQKEHLCSQHQAYLDRSPDYYTQRAYKLDRTVGFWVEQLFLQDRHPEQLYKTCDGIFSLYRNRAKEQVIKACEIAIRHHQYSYRFILNLLNNHMTGAEQQEEDRQEKPLPQHRNLRGKQYYQSLINFNNNESN